MKNKGITLVALIITIIVLLILATVSISLVINNGVLDKAQHGVDKYSEEEELEKIKLAVAAAMLKGNGFLDNENLNNELHERIGENENAEKIGSNYYYNGFVISDDGNVEKYDKLLPKEYQQVEYLESTGTQLIDTKIIANDIMKINCRFNITKNIGSHQGIIGGGWSSANNTFQLIFNANTVMINIRYGREILSIPYDTSIHNIIISKEKISIDNVEENVKSEINDNRNVYLFVRRRDNLVDGIQEYSSCRIFYCKINIINNLEKNLIPCYSTETVTNVEGVQVPANTKGLYDLVEGKFYTNKNTSGTDFIAGPEV